MGAALGGAAVVSSALAARGALASGAHEFEWAGIFETPDDAYVWQAEKVNDAYADATMKVVIYAETAAGHEELEAREDAGDTALGGSCTTVKQRNDVLTPGSGCVKLQFDNAWHTSSFKIDTTGVAAVSIFAEHVPTEFERDTHYLKDVNGDDVEPVASLPETVTTKKSKPWSDAIGAAIIVNIVTLSGVIFLSPSVAKKQKAYPEVVSCIINSFAAGALLSAAFYLMLYEATHLIKPAGSDESQQTAWWASAAIFGFLVAYIIDLGISIAFPSRLVETKTIDAENAIKGVQEDCETCHSHKYRVRSGIILGDFMHNLVDGIFIGFGFLNCGKTMGWSITAATVYHEIAQELADYLVLTDPFQGDLTPFRSLFMNFISGMSVILGVLISVGSGSNNDFWHGLLLAFGAGIYLQIAAAECMPRVSVSATSSASSRGEPLDVRRRRRRHQSRAPQPQALHSRRRRRPLARARALNKRFYQFCHTTSVFHHEIERDARANRPPRPPLSIRIAAGCTSPPFSSHDPSLNFTNKLLTLHVIDTFGSIYV